MAAHGACSSPVHLARSMHLSFGARYACRTQVLFAGKVRISASLLRESNQWVYTSRQRVVRQVVPRHALAIGVARAYCR